MKRLRPDLFLSTRKLILAFFLIFMTSMPAISQTYKGKPISHVSLVSGNITPGKGFTLGIKLDLEPEWHAYWKNPGDAGLPMTVELIDANGYSAGELRFPTPHKYVTGDAVLYGYDSEVVYLLPIKAPSGSKASAKFKVKLTWLACKEVCLPGEATLPFNADSVSVTERKDNQRILDRWTAKLPQPGAGFNLEKVRTLVTEKDEKISLFIKFLEMAPGTITDFFPDAIDGFLVDYTTIVIGESGITMTLTPETKDSKLTMVKGLVLLGTSGYEVNFPVSKQ
ncbi:MAG: protein-disulfide reductase DsbD family protein [Bacteroidota bacterium]|nr:protein-disulfide reductase DsbD family protein [Bacteroidota bacterium]